jgi:hypothetical protein
VGRANNGEVAMPATREHDALTSEQRAWAEFMIIGLGAAVLEGAPVATQDSSRRHFALKTADELVLLNGGHSGA